ncbi:heme A synthase [Nocardioides immobilis]|uniref:Heme A synthase n=1 Tax=Nocardioides immobilis TaxID=2049295 RepID=A0A417XYU0_9ACTN|nr:COX15/CtaA family protein [Nocardioides immobilis]RHW25534.1 heme A synthase [Nocardioides immobilis]
MGVTTAVRTAPSPLLVRLAWANLVANIGIVVTGGAVRLTGSGLGCPTWPRCTEDSYVVHGELGINGAIEFGNRTLTFVLAAIAIACWVAAILPVLRDRTGADRRPLIVATVIALGVPAQALIGGVTVLTDLNPWVVALHLLVSFGIIGACVLLLDILVGRPRAWAVPRSRQAALATFLVGWVVLYLGTVVTGSGPHSGDQESRRTGLDPGTMSHVHAWAVYALVALTILTVVLARRDGNLPLRTAALALLATEAVQAVIGYSQYFLDLPIALVLLHMLGAALTAAALAWLAISTRAHRTAR